MKHLSNLRHGANGITLRRLSSAVAACLPLALFLAVSGAAWSPKRKRSIVKRLATGLTMLTLLVVTDKPIRGDVLVSNGHDDRIIRFDNSGNATVFADSSDGLDNPAGMAVHPTTGEIFVVNFGQNNIVKFDHMGALLGTFADVGDGLNRPIDIAFDTTGNAYVSNRDENEIMRFDLLGNGNVFADASDGIDFPFELALDGTDNVYLVKP